MVKVALLIGVSEYQPGLQPLPSAIEDVRSMERVLKHPEMGGFDRVEVLTNPNTQAMRIAIYNLFAECSPEDLVLFYFSGHGVKDQNRNLYLTTLETTKNQKGLVVPPTAVAASYLQTQINDSRSQHEVIILDCCYSGAIAKGLTAKDEGAVDIIAELGGKGRAILTSSTSVQSSFQQSGSLSIYTQYLVEGIETGAADLDSDGQISADELHQYASKNVQQASPAMTPQFYPVEEGYRIYLARSPQDDPKVKYRKEAQKRAKKGKFSPIGRRILARRQIELGLSPEEAETIKEEILRPYREYQQKLQEYKQAYREVVEQEYPLSDYTRNELQDFQKLLELRDQDIAPIEASLNPQPKAKTETEPQVTESVPDSKPIVENQTENLGNDVTLDMVYIPDGTFMMGSPEHEGRDSEKPQHEVTVSPFFMGKYPITQAQYQQVMGENPSNFKGDDRPVELVSWDDAVEFCQRLSQQTGAEYRLPTEAEWEYAARAGTTTKYYFGDDLTSDLANYDSNVDQTTAVGKYPPNAFGLYDMHGNVWEWCQDDWHDSYKNAPTDGSAWLTEFSSIKVIRGGSWGYNPYYCCSATRDIVTRDNRFFNIGFRVVCVVPRAT